MVYGWGWRVGVGTEERNGCEASHGGEEFSISIPRVVREIRKSFFLSSTYFVLFSFLVKYLLEYFYLLVLYLSQFLLEFNDVFSESSMKLKFTVIYSSSKYCKVHLFVRSDLSRRHFTM